MNLVGRRYGHIRVERMLGQGGMGDVYEGWDETLGRRVALKVLHHPNQRLDQEARTRFAREARTLGRLDHPNVCRIYDFIDQDDVDVLVLEHIDGETLQNAMRDGLPYHEKLRVAQAIAGVLVVAHRLGIIHRDLKPENVMLTKSGEVKVLDFGLARWLERERRASSHRRAVSPAELTAQLSVTDSEVERWYALDADTTAVITPPNDVVLPDATAAGITVGTPLYMSPEQARGEPLTTASDLYAFGLLLQTLFTEKDPYPEGTTAREVMLKAARGDSLPVDGDVPRNVAALIRSLKALAPADRPTAVDTLRRIRYIVDTPKRYARRALLALAIVAVVFGAWKYVTDLRRERSAAQQAEAEARRRRAQADSLIGFMLGDLRTKLEPVGRLDILDDVAERSLAYMSSLDPRNLTPEELARNSKALNQLGEVRMSQGNLPAALRVFRQSLDFANAAAARDRANPELELDVGTAHFWVGNALRLQDDLPAALAQMREYRRITEDLASRYPMNDHYQIERAFGLGGVGTILEAQGDLASAVEMYRLALAVKDSRLAAMPEDAQRQADVAAALNKLATVLERLGRLDEALGGYRREADVYAGLARKDPKNMLWKDRIANSHEYLSWILDGLGDTSGALEHATAGLAIYRELSARDESNVDWRRNVAVSLDRRAAVLLERGAVSEALKDVGVAKVIIQQLLNRESRPAWRRDRIVMETIRSRALEAGGDGAAAREEARAAVAGVGEFGAGVPARVAADAFIALAEAEARHDPQSEREAWLAARKRLQSAAATTSDPRLLADYARSLVATGDRAGGIAVAARVRASGYRGTDFTRLCVQVGC